MGSKDKPEFKAFEVSLGSLMLKIEKRLDDYTTKIFILCWEEVYKVCSFLGICKIYCSNEVLMQKNGMKTGRLL